MSTPIPNAFNPLYVHILIRTLRNKTLCIDMYAHSTVNALKEEIQRKYGIAVETQQLFYKGRELKDKRNISTYKIGTKETIRQPILLTQQFKIHVFVSKKVLSLHSLIVNNDRNRLNSHQSIHCTSVTTISAIIKKLHLIHLKKMNLLKVCVGGTGTHDIKNFDEKIINIPELVQDGILTVILSEQWFLDRSIQIATISSRMIQTVEKIANCGKLLQLCPSFNRLQHEYNKTKSYVIDQFIVIDNLLIEQCHDLYKVTKWINQIIENNQDIDDIEEDTVRLINELQNKVEDINKTLRTVKKRWNKKSKQINIYLKRYLKKTEYGLMKHYQSWLWNDIVQWLQYMDKSIILTDDVINKFQASNVNGYSLAQINDLSLKLMGINDTNIRKLIMFHIDKLLNRNQANKAKYHDEEDTDESEVCCICVTNQVNTVITPCGHMVYCNECSRRSVAHCNKCPICRRSVSSIITVYKSGLHFAES